MKPRHAIFILFLILPLTLPAQVRVFHVNDSIRYARDEGVRYTLPMTRLVIDLTISMTSAEKGMFSEFAREMLNTDQFVKASTVRYELTGFRVSTQAEPDPAQVYRIERAGRFPWFRRSALSVGLSPLGTLESLNMKKEKPAKPFVAAKPEHQCRKAPQEGIPYFINYSLLRKTGNESRSSDTSLLPLIRPMVRKSPTDIPLREKAIEALGQLAGVQESRLNLANGFQEVNYPEGTIRLMFEQLEQSEETILRQFTGTTRVEEQVVRLTVLPDRRDPLSYILGYLDPVRGFRAGQEGEGRSVRLTLVAGDTPVTPATPAGLRKRQSGLVYRQPAFLLWQITEGDELKQTGSVMISQLGELLRLPASADRAILCPETGSLIRTGR